MGVRIWQHKANKKKAIWGAWLAMGRSSNTVPELRPGPLLSYRKHDQNALKKQQGDVPTSSSPPAIPISNYFAPLTEQPVEQEAVLSSAYGNGGLTACQLIISSSAAASHATLCSAPARQSGGLEKTQGSLHCSFPSGGSVMLRAACLPDMQGIPLPKQRRLPSPPSLATGTSEGTLPIISLLVMTSPGLGSFTTPNTGSPLFAPS